MNRSQQQVLRDTSRAQVVSTVHSWISVRSVPSPIFNLGTHRPCFVTDGCGAELGAIVQAMQAGITAQHLHCSVTPTPLKHKDRKRQQESSKHLSIPIHTSPPVTSESKVWSTRQQCTPMELWRSTARAKYDKMMRCLSTILHCELHCLSSCSPPPGLDDKIDIQGVRRQLRHFDEVWRRHGSSL